MGTLMIVEDDPIIREGLTRIAISISNDLNIHSTGYAEEALIYAKNNSVDAFFLDIQLEDYSGMLLADEIRKIENYKLTPIIFITSTPTEELLAFKELHCYDYILKPFSEEKVREAFNTIIKYGLKSNNKDAILKLKQKFYTHVLYQKDILYIEAINKKIRIKTIYDEIMLSTYSLTQLINDLEEDFFQCHKGFIINKRHIERVDNTNNTLHLKGVDAIIPLGRKYKHLLRCRA